MPYWNRQEALDRCITRLRDLYGDIEIIVVDDGCPEPAIADATVIRLPEKDHALNPCVPYNVGVEASKGDTIVLTNPEVIHQSDILGAMKKELGRLGPKGYVAASCWHPGKKRWYCHSTDSPGDHGRAKMPRGAGLHFCSMLSRELYGEIGGFSEEYRAGQAYDDNDLLWKLHHAGAGFSILDDCITHHIDTPRCKWPQGGAERNRKIFESRWGA